MSHFPIPKTIVHLLSGGMDSVVMLYDLKAQGHSVHCLLFNYGQVHAKELQYARAQCARLGVFYTDFALPRLRGSSLTDGRGGVVVPNRNAIFLSHAVNFAVVAKAETVTIGCNAEDAEMFPDCRADFIKAMNAVVQQAEQPVEICAPYLDKSKWWIARLGADLRVPISETWSCYLGTPEPCGKCPACLKREAALK